MQRFVFLASEINIFVPRVCQATSSCAMVLRMFYHGHYRVAIYCTGDLLLDVSGETLGWQISKKSESILGSSDWYLQIQTEILWNSYLKTDSVKFRMMRSLGSTVSVQLVILDFCSQNKSSLDDHGWSLPVPQEPMTSWHFFKVAPIEQLSKPAKKFYAP